MRVDICCHLSCVVSIGSDRHRSVTCLDWAGENISRNKQAEAEVVPGSILVDVKVEVGV